MIVKQRHREAQDRPGRGEDASGGAQAQGSPIIPERHPGWSRLLVAKHDRLPTSAPRMTAPSKDPLTPPDRLRRVDCLLARERANHANAMASLLAEESGSEAVVECLENLESLSGSALDYSHTLILIDAVLLAHAFQGTVEFTRILPTNARTMVLFDDWPDMTVLTRFLLLGISGCILLSSPASFYRQAISAIASGELWFPRQTMSEAIGRLLEPTEPSSRSEDDLIADSGELSGLQRLTEREQAIVELLRAGLTNKEIGRKLGISNETVKKHLARVFRRLGVRNRTQLALGADSLSAR